MIDYQKRSEGYDFSEKDGFIGASCMNKSIVQGVVEHYRDAFLLLTDSLRGVGNRDVGFELFLKLTGSHQSAILIKLKVLKIFKIYDIFVGNFTPFLIKCQKCANRCCKNACKIYRHALLSFLGGK